MKPLRHLATGGSRTPHSANCIILLCALAASFGTALGQINDVAASQYSIAFLCADGAVYSVGDDTNGVFGDGETVGVSPSVARIPGQVTNLTSNTHETFVAVDSTGSCFAWSWFSPPLENVAGSGILHHTPFRLSTAKRVRKVILSNLNALFLHEDSTLSASGDNRWGQLGIGTTEEVLNAPVTCTVVDFKTVDVAGGFAFTIALDADGSLHGWGNNQRRALSRDAVDTIIQPVIVRPEIGKVAAIWHNKAGSRDSPIVALTEDGHLYGWSGFERTFGISDNAKAVVEPHLLVDTAIVVTDVAVGGEHVLVLTKEGVVLAAGRNLYGVLGQRDDAEYLGFNPVLGLPPIERIYAVNNTCIAVDMAGSTWFWGFSSGLVEPDAVYTSPVQFSSPCSTVGVANSRNQSDRVVITSHTSDQLRLGFDASFACRTVVLYNLNGESVDGVVEVLPDRATIDLQNWTSGVYIAVATSIGNAKALVRFTVMR